VIAKFMTDPIWWFYVFWLPKYLNSEFGLTLNALGPPLIAIYCMADAGSIAGGWLAASFIRRGWPINRARKTAMLVCALAVVPIVFVSMAHNLWIAVALIGLATAGHQGWSANLFTLTSDLFPQRAVASVVGLGGFAGAVGGMLIAAFTGYLLQATGSYFSVFMMAASAYLLALAAVQGIAPRLDRVDAPADPETDVALAVTPLGRHLACSPNQCRNGAAVQPGLPGAYGTEIASYSCSVRAGGANPEGKGRFDMLWKYASVASRHHFASFSCMP